MLGIGWLDHDRHRVADHRPHLRHEVMGFFDVEGVRCDVGFGNLFPAVVDRGRVPSLQFQQVGVRETIAGL